MSVPANAHTPIAHTRFEDLDSFYYPRVRILVQDVPFEQWDRFVDSESLGISAQRSIGQAVGLLIDFMQARGHEFYNRAPDQALSIDDKLNLPEFHKQFYYTLLEGSFQGGDEKWGLYWRGRTVKSVKDITKRANRFLKWIEGDGSTKSSVPTREANVAEKIKFWSQFRIKKDTALLGHLHTVERARGRVGAAPQGQAPRSGSKSLANSKRFPHKHFHALLNKGFERRREIRWTTYRDQMIVLLLHGGGVRIGAALNMWIIDVAEDPEEPDTAYVKIYHPEEGIVHYTSPSTGRIVSDKRVNYLKYKYGMLPLSMQTGKSHAGTKHLLLTDDNDKYTAVFWRGYEYGRAFLRLFRLYMQLRPKVKDHPLLFITPQGKPMTVSGFEKVHAAAVRRIGLVPAKALGTTPHGHRHDYGSTLKAAGIDEKLIQIGMSHGSVDSQTVYVQSAALIAAQKEILRIEAQGTQLLIKGEE